MCRFENSIRRFELYRIAVMFVMNPKEFIVHVTVKKLEDVSSIGSGDIISIGVLAFPVLNFNINGSGDLRVKLNSDKVTIK